MVPIKVTFSEPVAVSTAGGTPQLVLKDVSGSAAYASGSGSATLTFDYTVASGQNTSDLDYITIGALTLNGGAIVDVSDRYAASLTLPPTGSDGLAAQHIVVQTVPVPAVANISPAAGPTTGDTIVTITGANFSGATAVYFGTAKAINFTVVSSTQITATSPPGTGAADVTVTGPEGVSIKWFADQFTYDSIWGPLLPFAPWNQ